MRAAAESASVIPLRFAFVVAMLCRAYSVRLPAGFGNKGIKKRGGLCHPHGNRENDNQYHAPQPTARFFDRVAILNAI